MNCRTIIFAVSALMLMSACGKSEDVLAGQQSDFVEFRISGSGYLTKLTDTAGENNTGKVQIAVYDNSGYLVNSGTMGGTSLKLKVPMGIAGYKVAAAVNTPSSIGDYTELAGLLDAGSSLQSNAAGGRNALEMFGKIEDIKFSTGTPYEVPVGRLAAKVEIDTVVNMIPSRPPFSISGIYLINVNTSCRLSGEIKEKSWSQKRKYISSEKDVTGYTADIFSEKLDYGQNCHVQHSFYCYANPTTVDSSSPTWCDRYTRLVVEAEYNGTRCYYPVNIIGPENTLEGGKLYRISKLTITGPGSDDPDKPISRSDEGFSIEVVDWMDGFSQELTY